MKYLILIFIISLTLTGELWAQPNQDHNLALQYYNKGEYDKAVDLFEELYENNPNSSYYYKYYYNTLLALKEYKKTEKIVKKQIKRDPQNLTYIVDLGFLYSDQGDFDKAKQQYSEAVEKLPSVKNSVIQLANAFMGIKEYDYAVKAYERGKKLVREYPFSVELGNLYRIMGRDIEMMESYLDYLAYAPDQQEYILGVFQDKIQEEPFNTEFQKVLYKRIQSDPNDVFYNNILIWLFLQRKDFESAFLQVKALDRRLKENGSRVFDFARTAMEEQKYKVAIDAYQYVISKGAENRFYFEAREGLLNARKNHIISGFDYTAEELVNLEKEYSSFLAEFGSNRLKAAKTLKDFAVLQAFYLHNLPRGIAILEELVASPSIPPVFNAECKLDLADCYLLSGEIWEATLLYSQVDKKMKDAPIGELARFKNAKLSYYIGDFLWAQSQLDVLKASTSELISNDALDLSVFITSNLGLDTSSIPMEMFARADLYSFQNKFADADIVLDSINLIYPGHTLGDDIYFLKGKMVLKQRDTEKAIDYFSKVFALYPDDLLADDAIFILANIYEKRDKEKAMEYYQKIIIDYPGSTYVIEARDKFRKLRGDNLN